VCACQAEQAVVRQKNLEIGELQLQLESMEVRTLVHLILRLSLLCLTDFYRVVKQQSDSSTGVSVCAVSVLSTLAWLSFFFFPAVTVSRQV
jgi:hypothetical protein